jgi:hypothetical protein
MAWPPNDVISCPWEQNETNYRYYQFVFVSLILFYSSSSQCIKANLSWKETWTEIAAMLIVALLKASVSQKNFKSIQTYVVCHFNQGNNYSLYQRVNYWNGAWITVE